MDVHRTPSKRTIGGPNRRRAAVTVLVLVVLVMMSALLAEFVHRVVNDRRQMRQEFEHQQAEYLAIAGVERMFRLREASPEFENSTWTIAPGMIHKTNTGLVTINVNGDKATVVAQYPTNHALPKRVTRTIRLK